MSSLSSLDNGGLSGVHTVEAYDVPAFVQFNDVVPGTKGFDNDQGYFEYRIRPAVKEGHILFYRPPGYDTCTMYCAIAFGDELIWKPVLIYNNISSKSTGKAL